MTLRWAKGDWRINMTAFGPDGVLYVHISDKMLNLWNLLSSFWPEAIAAVLGVLVIMIVVSWSRVKRRPQVRGGLHCRKCNYHLVGIGSGLCPECGVDPSVRRPVVGRSAARRMRVVLGVLAVVGLGYAGLMIGGVKRTVVSDLFLWPAPRLAELAGRHQIAWIGRFHRSDCSIVAVDPATGKVSRVIRGLGWRPTFGLSLSPDGRTLLTTLRDGELAAIDLKSRRITRRAARLDGGGSRAVYPTDGWVGVAGWLNAATSYVQFADGTSQSNELLAWDLKSGQMRKVCELSAWQSGAGARQARAYTVKTGDADKADAAGGGSLLGLERITSQDYGASSDIIVRDLTDDGREIKRLRGGFWAEAAPVDAGDGQFFIRHWSGADIGLWSIGDGAMVGEMEALGFMGTLQRGPAGLACDAERSRLFVATTNPDRVHVRDTETKAWIGGLSLVQGGLPDDVIALSADGRWAAIGCTEVLRPPAPGGFREHLLVFDLSTLEQK